MVLESFQLSAPPDSLMTAKPSIIRVGLKKSDPQQHLHRHQSQQKTHPAVNNALQQFVGSLLLCQKLYQAVLVAWGLALQIVRQKSRQQRQQFGLRRRLGLELGKQLFRADLFNHPFF